MKAVWNWIVKAAQDIYSTVWSVLGFLRDKTGKFSFKRVTGVAAFVFAIDFAFHGAWISSAILTLYCAIIAVVSALTGL